MNADGDDGNVSPVIAPPLAPTINVTVSPSSLPDESSRYIRAWFS